MTCDEIIASLKLRPHPEGGHYVETWRGADGPDGRAVGSAILFLLAADERSHWHRIDADEIWLHHAGAPLTLAIVGTDSQSSNHTLGSNLASGQTPQVVVPANAWQSARSTGAWTLVSCVVTPGFEFERFELAPPGWAP